MKPVHWAGAGALCGALVGLICSAPASLAAQALASATSGHLQLSDARGTIWSGSALLVFTGGEGSKDAMALPSRLHWQTGWSGRSFSLSARQDCCINDVLELRITPGWGRVDLAVKDRTPADDWLLRWPASLLAGLGTPWNTLELHGHVRVRTQGLALQWDRQGWRQQGLAQADLLEVSSRVSTLAPLGSYRFSILAAADGNTLQLQTLSGALHLEGSGRLSAAGSSFRGFASAEPGREAALDNLLNIIGLRQGARSVISLG
ncbi:MAG: type II secretion system protein N [Paucibacter sp.]|nr:type II secretion system protein N [Roseateles sp.]